MPKQVGNNLKWQDFKQLNTAILKSDPNITVDGKLLKQLIAPMCEQIRTRAVNRKLQLRMPTPKKTK